MRRIAIFLIIFSVVSCKSDNKVKKPDNLISQDKMVDILYDVFIISSAKGASKSILEDHGVQPEEYVFKKYQIDSLQFAMSNEYYGYNIEDYESILARLEERIGIEKDEIELKIKTDAEEKERIKDSLRKSGDTLKVQRSRTFNKVMKVDSIKSQVDSIK